MDNFEIVSGLVGTVISLLVVIFRRSFSRSRLIILKGFAGKSLADQFGEQNGSKVIGIFGLITLTLSLFVLLAGMFGIELPIKY